MVVAKKTTTTKSSNTKTQLPAFTWELACFPIRGRVPDPLELRRRTTATFYTSDYVLLPDRWYSCFRVPTLPRPTHYNAHERDFLGQTVGCKHRGEQRHHLLRWCGPPAISSWQPAATNDPDTTKDVRNMLPHVLPFQDNLRAT